MSYDPQIINDRLTLRTKSFEYLNSENRHPVSPHFIPGVGKSYDNLLSIRDDWDKVKYYDRIGSQWVIAIPKHDMVEGDNNMKAFFEDNEIPYAHIKGKRHFCTEPTGHTWENHTCSSCPLNQNGCPYFDQDWGSYVVICPFEMVSVIPRNDPKVEIDGELKGKYRRLIYDEMPFRNWMENITIPVGMEWTVIPSERKDVELCGAKYQFARLTLNCKFSARDSSPLTVLTTTNTTEYRYYQFLRRYEGIEMNGNYLNGRWHIFAFNDGLYPAYYQKCIVNCATTPDTIRLKIFGMNLKVISGTSVLRNPNVFIATGWSKSTTIDHVQDFIAFVKQFDGDKFIATKKDKEIEDIIKAALPDVDIVHFGEIGTNTFNKPYDAGFVFGGFHYTPLTRYQMGYRLDEKEINTMEDSVVIQAMHRCRPMLHEDTPLFIMSNKGIRKGLSDKPIVFPKDIVSIHGTYGIKEVEEITTKWGNDRGLNTTLRSQYKQFIMYSRRHFLGYTWGNVDDFLYCIDQNMTDKEMMDFCEVKSIKTIKKWKGKINQWRRSINLKTLTEDKMI